MDLVIKAVSCFFVIVFMMRCAAFCAYSVPTPADPFENDVSDVANASCEFLPDLVGGEDSGPTYKVEISGSINVDLDSCSPSTLTLTIKEAANFGEGQALKMTPKFVPLTSGEVAVKAGSQSKPIDIADLSIPEGLLTFGKFENGALKQGTDSVLFEAGDVDGAGASKTIQVNVNVALAGVIRSKIPAVVGGTEKPKIDGATIGDIKFICELVSL